MRLVGALVLIAGLGSVFACSQGVSPGQAAGIAAPSPSPLPTLTPTSSPRPTPDPSAATACEAATQALRAEYRDVQACAADADCSFIDGFYDVVPREDTARRITVFDCKVVTPFLVVADGALVRSNLARLEELKSRQETACAPPPGSFTCDGFGTIDTSIPPVCAQGLCTQLSSSEGP